MIDCAVCKIWLSSPPKIKSLLSYGIVPWIGHINAKEEGSLVGTVLGPRRRKAELCFPLICSWNSKLKSQSGPQSSGTVWKSRWPSWAFCPNEPYGFCGRKATLNHASALVTVCPWYVNQHPRTWSSTSSSPSGPVGGQELCESRGGRPGLPSLISLDFCGRKATLQQQHQDLYRRHMLVLVFCFICQLVLIIPARFRRCVLITSEVSECTLPLYLSESRHLLRSFISLRLFPYSWTEEIHCLR